MKKIRQFYLLLATMFIVAGGFTGCSDDDSDDDAFEKKEEALKPAVEQYVNNTVIATYRSLADAATDLYNALAVLKEDKTQDNLVKATDAWIKSRTYWELSEAFLFGAVADFGIDPHIDTWPLDERAFLEEMANQGHLDGMDAEDGDIWADQHLGFALLGFHGIEFILYKEGSPKNISEITDNELIYATAVGGDLRNQCIRLEAAWAGLDNVSEEKQQLIEDRELVTGLSTSRFNYSENMLNAGNPGSLYRTVTDAAAAIIEGCMDISAEVGEIKIGTAFSKEDVNYIESPYSFNSKTDFADNIRSIANAYLGGADETKRGASVSDYIKSVDQQLDADIKASIINCIGKIGEIPTPFARNYASQEAGAAMEACDELTTLLNSAKSKLQE
ncbi:MAG: peptidase M75 [Dysgonamonadaceae bacterium]|jgi:hypothetical protein|nr:peptidase M75 [Dysgonamonadaceae bacterium]